MTQKKSSCPGTTFEGRFLLQPDPAAGCGHSLHRRPQDGAGEPRSRLGRLASGEQGVHRLGEGRPGRMRVANYSSTTLKPFLVSPDGGPKSPFLTDPFCRKRAKALSSARFPRRGGVAAKPGVALRGPSTVDIILLSTISTYGPSGTSRRWRSPGNASRERAGLPAVNARLVRGWTAWIQSVWRALMVAEEIRLFSNELRLKDKPFVARAAFSARGPV